ncbi:hypothetical protein SDC9_209136 [bioreactor metagenome]|uniref:Uncharacterized protein n=1 Tax=bioreactor metagenome TaxID=1076179 RepID=A0A645JFF3_9ZZZZ
MLDTKLHVASQNAKRRPDRSGIKITTLTKPPV